ncbi:hypothetical protein GCM10011391_04900 [Pullulanibacillus camelliae]|uniref:ATP-grasp domain-containing protein n=1 Tax=Pullulanibacillus camelliae TaxID=1707096 RepID=A0A8J2YFD1_9BACL|nr:hypothetical protein [Pullulanibacillus camelliae]GGE29373.1 hypothetical protein GCM10011391_04900 [Pullulanibacillus camelliae]
MKSITFNPLRTLAIPNTHYIKPELMFRHREDIAAADWILFPDYWQVNSLVYGLKKQIFPSVASYHLGHNKIEMTRAFQLLFPDYFPYTEILANTPTNTTMILETFPFPFIAKEIKNSMGKGVFIINNEQDLINYANANDVLYVQEYLPIDRDIRLTLVGEKVIGAYWRIGREDSHLNNVSQGGQIAFDPVPRDIIDLVETVAQTLNINHAGFDVAIYNGHPYFFEFNTLFGNVGLQKMNLSIEEHIYQYLVAHHTPTKPPFLPDFNKKKTS